MRRLLLSAAALGAMLGGAGLVAARGTLMSDQNLAGGSSGGASCPSGSTGDVVTVGSGGACAAAADLTVGGVIAAHVPLEVVRATDASIYAQVITTSSTRSSQVGPYNAESGANGLFSARGSNASSLSGSFLGVMLNDDVDFKVSGASTGFLIGTVDDAPLILGTHDADRLHITATGDVELSGPLAKVRGATPAGSCTLDGANPSRCTVSVADGSVCVCSVRDSAAGAKDGCSVSRTGTTLTITSANGATWAVSWVCL